MNLKLNRQTSSHGIVLDTFTVVFIVALVIEPGISQTIEDEFNNPCMSATDCSQCIQTSHECAWCGAEKFSSDLSRCDLLSNLLVHCEQGFITNPKSNFYVIDDGSSRQVKPHSVAFSLRPNQPQSFKVTFQQKANYPVDLYFLLDLSYGMYRQKEAQERLIALGKDIPRSMVNITNNFRLGFGTFVDKLLMPYSTWTDQMLKNVCPKKNKQCQYPHDFKNQMSLGSELSSFAGNMEKALENISLSLDDAEAGLDGLIQVLDCDVIGWREVSRRIIVYSSNSLFHLAGAGRLGGATKQNPLSCNLNPDGSYAMGKIYDYPSVSQIASKLRDSNANVIFAVMDDVTRFYTTLATFLDGAAVVGELESNSKNIVGLIRDKYYELRSRIQFRPSKASDVHFNFRSKCKGSTWKETSACWDLKIMDSVEFEVTVTVSDEICRNKVGTVKKEVMLDSLGLNEAVKIRLNVQCSCFCEHSSNVDNSSSIDQCTFGNGTFGCGICNCNPGRFGKNCECDRSDISEEKSFDLCKPNGNTSLVCSGHGECICGVCECFPIDGDPHKMYTGRYCECNNFNCFLGDDQQLCGGITRGVCKCGVCECLPGWSGNKCQCTTDEHPCLASNGQVCNGVGECQCGRCVCEPMSGRVGPTCEDCLTCPSQCNEYVDCAQCRGFQSGSYDNQECQANCNIHIIKKSDTLSSGDGIRRCQGTDVDQCTFFFTYHYDAENFVVLTVQETKSCLKEVPLAAIIGGTVSAIVVIGLLIICLYVFIRNLKDKEEYAKFLRDKEKARWDVGANPIFRGATTTFQNPDYQGLD